jgi:hypothetical protein
VDDDRTVFERLYRSGDSAGSVLPLWTRVRNVVTAVIALALAIQLVIWVAVVAGAGRFAFPWWIWTLAGGAIIVGLLSVVAARQRPQPGQPAPGGGVTTPRPASRQPWQFSWSWLYRIVWVVFIVSSAAQLAVWLVQGMASNSFDSPWWTWSVLPLAIAVAVVGVLARDEKRRDGRSAEA